MNRQVDLPSGADGGSLRRAVCIALALGLGASAVSAASFVPPWDEPRSQDGAAGVERDLAGRRVRTADGERLSYATPAEEPFSVWSTAAPEEVEATAAEASDLFARSWSWSVMGTGIGSAGLHVADLEGDGQQELIVAGGVGTWGQPRYWYIMRWTGTGYEQVWTSPSYETVLVGIDVVQADEDSGLEVVAVSGGAIAVYDGASHQLQGSFAIPVPDGKAIAAGDVDADGVAEVVVIDSSDLFVFDLSSGALEAMRFGFGGQAVALGRVDDDVALEVAVANGAMPGSILDGRTLQVQWGLAAGLGDLIAFGNLDGDVHDELVAGGLWAREVRAFDLDGGVELYRVSTSQGPSALTIENADADAQAEVLYGDEQWGSIHVLTGNSGAEEWAVANPEHGVTRIAAGDFDGDGAMEVTWGAGQTSSGADFLFVADSQTHLREWQSRDLVGPFYALSTADLEPDREVELIAGSRASYSGYGDGALLAFDLHRNREVPFPSPAPTGSFYDLQRVRAGNLDLDPQDEVCYPTGSGYTAAIDCFDSLTLELQWRVSLPEWLWVVSLDIQNLDGDRSPEVIVGVAKWLWAAPGEYVYCFSGESGWLKWRSEDLGEGGLTLLRVANVDDDAAREVVVGEIGGPIHVLDGVSGAVEYGPIPLPLTALDLADRTGDGSEEIYVGLADGTVRMVGLASGETTTLLQDLGGAVDALSLGEMDDDPVSDFAVSVGGRLSVFGGASGTQLWRSGFLGLRSGEYDSLLFADLDGDERGDLVVNMSIGIAAFLTNRRAGLPFSDGFESRPLLHWSRVYSAAPWPDWVQPGRR